LTVAPKAEIKLSADASAECMANQTDDAVPDDLILGARRIVSSEVGPIANRLTKDFAKHSAPIKLAVRLTVACMYLAGAHISERKNRKIAPAVYSLQRWKSLASIPVSDACPISIEQQCCSFPSARTNSLP